MANDSENADINDLNQQMNDMELQQNKEYGIGSDMECLIRSALNQQTSIQYRQYAAEQHPKEPYKQEELVKQLQEQYFQQYITQVYEMQKVYQTQQIDQLKSIHRQELQEVGKDCEQHVLEKLYPALPLLPANLWTRKDISEFKADILKNQRECCIKIGSLSTATVRVPTHPEGKFVFWEFATDYYDLGFGIYFEWNVQPSENITVHISESSDEEEDEEYDEESATTNINSNQTTTSTSQDPSSHIQETAASSNPQASSGDNVTSPGQTNDKSEGDLESGTGRGARKSSSPPTDELIPVFRRDCHQEVYCGSHQYPGRGTYVLKFDNSYSIWRSKWLYYRVYYTK